MRANDRRLVIRHPLALYASQFVIGVIVLWMMQIYNTYHLSTRLKHTNERAQQMLDRSTALEERLTRRANELLQGMDDPADRARQAMIRAAAVHNRDHRHVVMTQAAVAQAEDDGDWEGHNQLGEIHNSGDDVVEADLLHSTEVHDGSHSGTAEAKQTYSEARASALLDKYEALLKEVDAPAGVSGDGSVPTGGDRRKRQRRPAFDGQAHEVNFTKRFRASDTDRHTAKLRIMGSANRTDKVAFLFLTRGRMPFEKVWAKFFSQDTLGRHSIFVHAPTGSTYPPESIWHGRNLPSRSIVKVMWGEPSMVEAERALLQHALLDPGISKFALVSDSDVPVQSFECAHKTMTEKPHSFAQSVPMTSQMPLKIREFMSPKVWRKGSQWFVLNREHAHMVAEDRDVFPLFKRYCTIYRLEPCISDEHYIPTLLAYKKAEATTQLYRHSLTWTDWHKGSPSPETIGKNAPVKSKILDIRRCHYSGPNHSKKVFYPLMMREECGEKTGEEYFSGLGNINDADEIRRPCFVFARKFAPELANKISGSFETAVGVRAPDASAALLSTE